MNRILAAYKQKGGHPIQYKIGPDPSSIDSCMIGGILNNNSSGMCCGVSQNTYNTLKDIRLVLADGTVLDTGDEASRAAFLEVGTFGDSGDAGRSSSIWKAAGLGLCVPLYQDNRFADGIREGQGEDGWAVCMAQHLEEPEAEIASPHPHLPSRTPTWSRGSKRW